MARKKAEAVEGGDEGRTAVVKKSPTDWMSLIKQVAEDHWRTLEVTIKVRDRLLAGKPASLDAAQAMIKARGLEDVLEAKLEAVTDPIERAKLAEEASTAGLCEFHRRDGYPGIWFPTNHIKAGLKENWSVLGLRVEHRGSRGALAEGVFVFSPSENPVERDWVWLGSSPDGVHTAVAHTTGPSGPVSSIKRHEYVLSPELTFRIAIAQAIAEKLPDDAMARTLYHFGEHGLGACRSQGFGRFDLVNIRELEGSAAP